jgi:hypothetical protein
MNRTHWNHALFVLGVWVGLAGTASCLSSDEAPAGERVEHPQTRAPMPVASAEGAPQESRPPHEGQFTALDLAIAGDRHGVDCVLAGIGGENAACKWLSPMNQTPIIPQTTST